MRVINIAKDFSTTPGARFKKDGRFSGEEFREKCLRPVAQGSNHQDKVRVELDGVEGYATSFLEEAFGGLAREFPDLDVLNIFEFVSRENTILVDKIKSYIKAAKHV